MSTSTTFIPAKEVRLGEVVRGPDGAFRQAFLIGRTQRAILIQLARTVDGSLKMQLLPTDTIEVKLPRPNSWS